MKFINNLILLLVCKLYSVVAYNLQSTVLSDESLEGGKGGRKIEIMLPMRDGKIVF